MKKVLYFILIIITLLLIAYAAQPVKKGKGSDLSVHYEWIKEWPALSKKVKLGNPTGLGMDTGGNLVVFHRAGREWPLFGGFPDSPIPGKTLMILHRNSGELLHSWGDNQFIMPHGLTVDSLNHIWVTDVGLHQVFKFSYNGKLLMKLGEAKVPGNDSLHFNRPTDVAIASDGSIYVSDGYRNSRIVKFSAEGKYLFQWGTKGSGEGEFDIPHSITLDGRGNVYVADRENARIQKFDAFGKFILQWKEETFGEMTSVFFDPVNGKIAATDDFSFFKLKHRGSDVMLFDTSGNVRTRFGRSGQYDGPACWFHDIAMDEDGTIYAADILGNTIRKFRKQQ